MVGRPAVDRIATSRHHNMKELRASSDGTLRVLFAFDPLRQAILLIAATRPVTGMRGTYEWFR
ncbi:MAG: type II toxin-antitoxin system RelE/ParE family toxin [Acidimicrobiales bacterium]